MSLLSLDRLSSFSCEVRPHDLKVILRIGHVDGIHWLQLNRNLSALRCIPSLNNLQMMPRSREELMDFKMSIAI